MKRRLALTLSIGLLGPLGLANPIGEAAPCSDWYVYLPLIARPKENPRHTGKATYYDATGAGACSFDPSPNDLMVTAMNNDEYSSTLTDRTIPFIESGTINGAAQFPPGP